MRQASLNMGVLHLATTFLSFELAGIGLIGLIIFIIFPFMYDGIVKTKILIQR